jgi:hypothetical protein
MTRRTLMFAMPLTTFGARARLLVWLEEIASRVVAAGERADHHRLGSWARH